RLAATAAVSTLPLPDALPIFDRPPELAAGDLDTPLGQALLWLHRNLVMDISERDTTAGAGGVTAAEADDRTDDDLWDRLEREQRSEERRVGKESRSEDAPETR